MEIFERYENVWDAIEEDPKEAARMTILSDLMIQVRRIVEQNRWSLVEAADRFQTTPEKVDDVLAGRINRLQPGELFQMVTALGRRVTVEIAAA